MIRISIEHFQKNGQFTKQLLTMRRHNIKLLRISMNQPHEVVINLTAKHIHGYIFPRYNYYAVDQFTV